VLVTGARRLLTLFGAAAGITLVGSLALGAVIGASPRRALSVGFYLAGSFLLLAGFFVGNRGVLRADSDAEEPGRLSFAGARRVRSATGDERRETARTSALVIALGVSLLIVGVLADTENELV
jgi:hypothetical protein